MNQLLIALKGFQLNRENRIAETNKLEPQEGIKSLDLNCLILCKGKFDILRKKYNKNASDDDEVSNAFISLVSWKNNDKGTSIQTSAVSHILWYLECTKTFKSICSVKIHDNVCHVVDRSSYLAYTILLWHGDQAVRFKKSEVSRIN